MTEEITSKERIALARQKIEQAKAEVGRTDEVCLLAATKMVDVDTVNRAIREGGLTDIGENRVQELLSKYDRLDRSARLHFIGRLQTNKVKYIIDKVCMIHSVDSERLAREIDKQAKKHGLCMDILIEVKIGGEESKGGVPPSELPALLQTLRDAEHIRVCGMMVIPPPAETEAEQEDYFTQSHRIFRAHFPAGSVLSMGMSDSYESAVRCGATLVRLGTVLFGKRPPYRAQTNQDPENQ